MRVLAAGGGPRTAVSRTRSARDSAAARTIGSCCGARVRDVGVEVAGEFLDFVLDFVVLEENGWSAFI